MQTRDILEAVREVSDDFAADRKTRQLRRELHTDDFERLKDAGFTLTGVPRAQGGIWEGVAKSTRPIAEILRVLARGDPSVALVCSMHPAVLSFWLASPQAPPPYTEAWQEQLRSVCQTAVDGVWWGTITSEPGSGGDLARTKTGARRQTDGKYLLSGQKHFGSGSGVSAYMVTTALPEGESEPDWFFMDMRGRAWDGSAGLRLIAPWDGHGMAATQSHAFELTDMPAARMAWPGSAAKLNAAAAFVGSCFAAVVLGIVESAIETAKQDLGRKRETLRPYEKVEWARAEMEAWLAQQAYEGMLRNVETKGPGARLDMLRGKTTIAELAESVLSRICRIVGGATFGRGSPYGFWFEDVRALGFLRPPWGLAFDNLYDASWPA